MKELSALLTSLEEDETFHHRWRETKIEFERKAGNFARQRRLLKRNLVQKIRNRIEAGERNVEKITEEVYGSLTGVVLTIALKLLIEWLVERILKRWS